MAQANGRCKPEEVQSRSDLRAAEAENTDREFRYLPDYEKKPISTEVVIHLYETVRKHLTEPWVGGASNTASIAAIFYKGREKGTR